MTYQPLPAPPGTARIVLITRSGEVLADTLVEQGSINVITLPDSVQLQSITPRRSGDPL